MIPLKYNYRNMYVRWVTTLLTVVATALVVGQAWDGPLEELRDSRVKLALAMLVAAAAIGSASGSFSVNR